MNAGSGLAMGSGFILFVGWIGYPAVLSLLGRSLSPRGREGRPRQPDPVDVAVVIATRDAPDLVHERVADIRMTNWPLNRLNLVIGVDPSAPHSINEYRRALADHPGVSVVAGDAPGGKAATLNAALRGVSSPVVVFADSAQWFAPDAIGALVAALAEESAAGVTGSLSSAGDVGLLNGFWRYELSLRRLESRLGCVVNVTGAIHAMRRKYWEPIPAGLISDDLLIPLRLARQGLRVVMADAAIANDPRVFTRDEQFTRKVRTLTGILQICVWEPWVLIPWKHRMWASFLCHKLIRVATPVLCGISGLGLILAFWPGWHVFALLGALVGLVTAGIASCAGRSPLVAGLVWPFRLLSAPLYACRNAVLGNWDVWPARTPHQDGGRS